MQRAYLPNQLMELSVRSYGIKPIDLIDYMIYEKRHVGVPHTATLFVRPVTYTGSGKCNKDTR